MITTIELLDALKVELDLPSDYSVAKLLNVSHQAVSRWRNGKPMGEENAIVAARLLKLDEDMVILSNLVERQTNEQAKETILRLMAS